MDNFLHLRGKLHQQAAPHIRRGCWMRRLFQITQMCHSITLYMYIMKKDLHAGNILTPSTQQGLITTTDQTCRSQHHLPARRRTFSQFPGFPQNCQSPSATLCFSKTDRPPKPLWLHNFHLYRSLRRLLLCPRRTGTTSAPQLHSKRTQIPHGKEQVTLEVHWGVHLPRNPGESTASWSQIDCKMGLDTGLPREDPGCYVVLLAPGSLFQNSQSQYYNCFYTTKQQLN